MERLHGGSSTSSTTNSSSSTVSHLQATQAEEHHLQQSTTSVATTESIDHHFAEHYTSSGQSQNHHANSDHTFHPISASEGLQVKRWSHYLKITQNVALELFNSWHFPSIFVLRKVTCLVTLSDRKLQVFKNSSKLTIFGIFNELLSTQNVNVARFACNVECDF